MKRIEAYITIVYLMLAVGAMRSRLTIFDLISSWLTSIDHLLRERSTIKKP